MGALHQDLGNERDLIETHISWVLLGSHDVYKVKKPVNFGFLDFTDLEKRLQACLLEVELNRRLTHSVYYGVVPITRSKAGVHEIAGQGTLVDWAVHMRRLPDADRADLRLRAGRLSVRQLDAIALSLAQFHARVGPSALSTVYGGLESVRFNMEENFEQSEALLLRHVDSVEAAEIISGQRDFVRQAEGTIAARATAGRVREGHGDLRLEHIYLSDDGVMNIIDCVEFNQRFRIADVCADIAFLAMDLARSGRADLAERVLATYARESNDFELYALVDFYQSYRAFTRGKIAALIADRGTLIGSAQKRTEEDAHRHFLLALASLRRFPMPVWLVAVGGIIASGKSTVAQRLSAEMGAPVVEADRTRKHLAGIDARRSVDDAAFAGMYSQAFTDKTYEELVQRGATVLSSGRSVVLDASFRTRKSRQLAKATAEALGAHFLLVECQIDAKTCRQRLRAREQARGVSDGRIEILQDFLDRWEPVTEFGPEQHLVLDTSKPLKSNIERVKSAVPMWPSDLVG